MKSAPSEKEGAVGAQRRGSPFWVMAIFFVVGALPGMIATTVVASYLLSQEQPVQTKITDTTLVVQASTEVPTSLTPLEVSAYIPNALVDRPATGNVCTTKDCRFMAQWLRTKLNFSIDPCQDFYGFVCGTFEGNNVIQEMSSRMFGSTWSAARATRVPDKGQNAWEKSVALYKSCLGLVNSNDSQTKDLVDWMASLNLDLANMAPLATFDPVDMFVRLALDFGFPATFGIDILDTTDGNKREMLVTQSVTDVNWRVKRLTLEPTARTLYYHTTLALYGLDAGFIAQVADTIETYESEVDIALNGTSQLDAEILSGPIRSLGNYTQPRITADKWAALFSKYTNNMYGGRDPIYYHKYILEALVKLLDSARVGVQGVRYLIAWTVFREHLDYTVPARLQALAGSPQSSCTELVKQVMPFAFTGKYLHFAVPERAIREADAMATNLRAAFRAAFMSSSWVKGRVRDVALRKLAKMKQYVGSSLLRRDDASVNKYYESFPDMPSDRFFNSWRRARLFYTHDALADRTNYLYDDGIVNAYYTQYNNIMVIPTAVILPIFFFGDGPAGFNYGGLGQVMGHEMMHGYDVTGVQYDENNEVQPWGTKESGEVFLKKSLCLRASHKAALGPTARQDVLNDTLDSENLADFVGAINAYAAFEALPVDQRSVRLPELNLTAERLFFVGLCTKWCTRVDNQAKRYAPGRSRCIVPLMNMPEFSAAFSCPPKSYMNPPSKCTFWK